MARKNISDRMVCDAFADAKRLRGAGVFVWPDQLLRERSGEPEKVVLRAMERACSHGLVDYGVSLRAGWLTDAGLALAAGP